MTTFRIPIDTNDPEIAELWSKAQSAIEQRLTLENIQAAFLEARIAAAMTAKYVAADAPPKMCRYCGRYWGRVQASQNDGHAKCIVTPAFQLAVAEFWWHAPGVTRDQIAEACGVKVRTVWAWTEPKQRVRPRVEAPPAVRVLPRPMNATQVADLVGRVRTATKQAEDRGRNNLKYRRS